jgi:transcriptional antiterminator RfaH
MDFLLNKTESTFPSEKKLLEKKWHVLWTNARAEKKVFERLQECNIEAFLPLQKTIRHWKDRKKIIEIPLFPSYLFVNVSNKNYFSALNIQGAARFIYFEGKAATISEKQIDTIKLFLNQNIPVEVTSGNVPPGSKVKIVSGALMGIEAEITNYLNKEVVVLRLDGIRQNMLVHIPSNFLEVINYN